MRNLIREIAEKTVLFLALIAVLWLGLVLSSAVPNSKIAKNMEKSALCYKDAEPFSFENGKKLNAISDNYADSIILNLSYNMGRGNPFKSSLDTGYYSGEEAGLNIGLYLTVTEDVPPDTEYTRYWHGTAMFLRIMHLFTDVSGIKTVGLITVLLLLAANLFLLVKRKSCITATALLLASALVHIWNAALSLEYLSSFIIGFAMCLTFLVSERKHEKLLSFAALAGGCIVAFFDFLTTETVAILLPLILITVVRMEDGRLNDTKKHIKTVINCLIPYALSYGAAFLMKWAVSGLVTGKNTFTAALSKSEALFSGTGTGESVAENILKRMINAVLANLTVLAGGEQRIDLLRVFIFVLALSAVLLSVLYVFKKEHINKGGICTLLILGAVVLVRYMALPGHSYLHGFFTYRALISTLTAIFAAVGLCINTRRVRKSGKV